MSSRFLLAIACLPIAVAASPWQFTQPRDISVVHGPGIFHHLGSDGRFGVSTSDEQVGIVWEDNRDKQPRCYLAVVSPTSGQVLSETKISGEQAAFEPVVQGVDNGLFAVAWEEDGGVWLRLTDDQIAGPALRLDESSAAHVALSWHPMRGLVAVWSQKDERYFRIWLARLDITGGIQSPPTIKERFVVETGKPSGDQTYPAVVTLSSGKLHVAWEDRRHGHTMILASHEIGSNAFSTPSQVNESFWGGRKLGLGRGTGAMRVSLAATEADQVIAVWADKRDFRSGYDVYAAVAPGDSKNFGDDQKVQDEFADGVAQWHPSVAQGGEGPMTVAWDDDREEGSDIWISWMEAEGWSADLDLPGASGDGVQVQPALSIDRHGGLHLAWVEKLAPGGPSRVRYLFAPLER